MIKLRYYSFKTLLVISLFSAVPVLVIAAKCPEQVVPESLHSIAKDHSSLSTTVVIPQSAPTLALMPKEQQMALGKKVYERSCMHCHGVQPRNLNYHDADSFIASVLHGTELMPALGFKLSLVEAQLTRLHIASCSSNYSNC